MKALVSIGLTAGLAVLLPIHAGATSIPESFTISGSANFSSSPEQTLFGTSFPQFNPALGTLNDIQFSLTGNARLSSSADNPILSASLDCCGGNFAVAPNDTIFGSGSIALDISGTQPALTTFEGTGTTSLKLVLDADLGDSLAITSDGGLQGTVTYDYTPAATSVPEPLILSLFGAGLAGAAAMRRRKAK